jgi:hypothetical protein
MAVSEGALQKMTPDDYEPNMTGIDVVTVMKE